MSNLRNSVRLTGFLGNAPEVREFGDDKKLARASLAINQSYTNDKGDRIEDTHWHTLIFWNKQASLAEKILHKGSEVSIDGKLVNRTYTDKDGIKKYVTEIIVNEIMLITKKISEA